MALAGTASISPALRGIRSIYALCGIRYAVGIRHAFDSGAANISPAEVFAAYGASADNKVTGKAFRCHQTPFGSHHGARGTIFENCLSVDSYGGVGVRGIGNRAVSCVALRCEVGFASFDQTGLLSKTTDTTFENCHAILCNRDLAGGVDDTTFIGGTYFSNPNFGSSPARLVSFSGNLTMRNRRSPAIVR